MAELPDLSQLTVDNSLPWYQLASTTANQNAQTQTANKSLSLQAAQNKAQKAYQSKLLELQRQGMGLQADQIAKSYAMDQAKLEFEKQQFTQTFGETQAQNQFLREFQTKQSALDEAYRVAAQTGFRDGVPTLENLAFQESQRQFNVNQGNNERDFGEGVRQYNQNFGEGQRQYNTTFGEGQRQFNVSQVLSAPRGPADWGAYTERLRGMKANGTLPGAVSSMFNGDPVASYSNGGMKTGPVLSNTQLALAMTGQGDPAQLNGTAWQGMSQPMQSASAPSTGVDPTPSSSSSPYGDPYGDQQSSRSSTASQGSSDWSLPSLQKFRRYSPTEQQMGLGYAEENGGPTAEDSQYLMQRSAPNFGRSAGARFSGM